MGGVGRDANIEYRGGVMESVRQDLKIAQGTTFQIKFEARTGAGAAFTLEGWTARSQAREQARSGVAIIDLSTENGGISIDAATGAIVLTFSPVQTAALLLSCEWDLFIYSPLGAAYRLVYGEISPILTVTRND